MCLGASKLSLSIAVHYSSSRLAVGGSGRSDTPIMQYQVGAIILFVQRLRDYTDLYMKFEHIFCAILYSWLIQTQTYYLQLQQRALMPLVATTYALSFALTYAKQRYEKLQVRRCKSVITVCSANAAC